MLVRVLRVIVGSVLNPCSVVYEVVFVVIVVIGWILDCCTAMT